MIDAADIARLQKAQEQHALDSLSNPGDKSEFEYGRRCGVLEGIRMAQALLLARMDEEDRAEKDF